MSSAKNSSKEGFGKEQLTDHSTYDYINVFKNPSNLPINQIHLERTKYVLKKNLPKDVDFLEESADNIRMKWFDKVSEIIPALDKRWLPKCILHTFEPYTFTLSQEENKSFITKNLMFMESLEFLLTCDFHQFWCTILFEPSAAVSLRKFILNPIPHYQTEYLEDEYFDIYKTVFNMFILVYERLITFWVSEKEYIPKEFIYEKLLEKRLINLPIVNTLVFLYKHSNMDFINKLTTLYFDNTAQLDFQIHEVEETVNHTLMVFEMIGGHVCGFAKDAVIVPIAIPPRPLVFNLSWVYSVVNYLLNTVSLLNTLLQFYKPSIEMCLNKELPFRMPFIYATVYRELYVMLEDREELKQQKNLSDKVLDEINLGRSEFINVYHMFISHCIDKSLEYMGDIKQQEHVVETYLKLLTTALEDEYFICDYNLKYNIANQNEVFESCTNLDTTRTDFIVSCINKLQRNKTLQELSKLKKQTIEDVFKQFRPPIIEPDDEPTHIESALEDINENDIDVVIKDIVDMFPHLGDGFVLKCLECYNFQKSDVINAILEENLPPHLYEIPFDTIRIPPEPEPEKPVLAYRGKKPDYDDALKLLNDKSDIKELKSFVLEGIQYSNDHLYDDEYDDRYDYDAPIKVADNPLEEEVLTFNPNHEDLASDTSYSSDEEYDDNGKPVSKAGVNGNATGAQNNRSKMNFCEDPAVIRARREAKFQSKNPQRPQPPQKTKVVGKPKGQGQEKDVLKARDKKNVNKSSRANHSRKSGAQWKRTRGMVPS
ncbi:unnamed protein product [Phaedon cochleariae]|uniref:CUE domain-containing protein n=1 Tax=Phaedon cochleariae TaxID=80249 RepID=A0A9N9WZT9_PHACE|nr:unnamed protein product [Phaedon cochleariae]